MVTVRPPEARRRRLGRPHYAWVVAGITFVTLLGAAGFRSAPAVLLVPLHDEFGWSRATVSAAVSVNLILFGLAGPFAAALTERFGLRRVVVGALVVVSTGAVLTVSIRSPWQLIALWGVVVGIGSGCMATVLAATVASRWFVARRGIVVGALTAAGATGQLIFLPVLGWLVENVGWRAVSITVAAGAAAVIPLVALFLRDRPEDIGLLPYGATEPSPPPGPPRRPVAAAMDGLNVARRSGAFWLLAGSFFVCGASTNGLIGTHFISASVDHGMAQATAAGLLAFIGIFDIAGTLASGWLTDRVDPRRLLFAYYALRGLSLLVLHDALGTRGLGLVLFIAFYGLDWVATVPPTVALCNDLFGPTRAPVVFGWVFAGHQIGAATAAYLAGFTRELTGNYHLSFAASGVLCLIAAVAVTRIRRVPYRPAPSVLGASIPAHAG